MDKIEELKIVEETQAVVAQMKINDMEENPDSMEETFDCDCCGATKIVAGSVMYHKYVLCNDCVLFAELGYALNKIKTIDDLILLMEEKRLKEMCAFILEDQAAEDDKDTENTENQLN